MFEFLLRAARLSFVLGFGFFVLLLDGCTQGFIERVEIQGSTSAEGTVRLTSDPTEEYAPSWSPDGRHVVYTVKDQQGNFDIALIHAEGGRPVYLTTNPTYDGIPSWSPDGKEIAFESDRDFHADIWVMDARGQNLRKLTQSGEGTFTPTWSPDGTRILYESVPVTSRLSGNRELWVIHRNGQDARKLADGFNPEDRDLFFTTGHFHGSTPSAEALTLSKPYEIFTCGLSWSPDGKKIAFESIRAGSVAIWTMNSDGTNIIQLTRGLSNNWHPVWSPDGNSIAFSSDRGGNYDIWIMDAAGNNLVPVTKDAASDFRPSWSPDGRKIVFTSLRSGNADLWIADVQI